MATDLENSLAMLVEQLRDELKDASKQQHKLEVEASRLRLELSLTKEKLHALQRGDDGGGRQVAG